MSENTRIAKNTLFLYFRSFLTMAIGLYTSRLILQALGVSDYGLYGVVGSIVAMFSILNGVLSAGTSRFLTFELGSGNAEKLKKIFSASFTLHALLAVVLFVLLETIGLWFLNYKMAIPEGREFAANVVYQLSILTCMFSLTQVPYGACIIAHEKMNIYAYVGIVEVIFKLLLVTVLTLYPFTDNLIAFSIIVACWSLGLQCYYRWYCYNRFPETHLIIVKDKEVYKSMLSYSLWDFLGSFCATGNSQGLNILINLFFGVKVNAARAVALQVENAITQFAGNFMVAVRPQIVKSYAQKDYLRFFELIFESSRLSYFLLFILSLPVLLEAEYILSLWLVEVPQYAVLFVQFTLLYQLFRIPMRSIIHGIHATGEIKYLNLTSGLYSAGTFLLFIYIAYKLGAPVWSCFVVQFFNGIFITYFEMNSLYREMKFSRKNFIVGVFLKNWLIALLSAILGLVIINSMEPSFFRLLITTSCSLVSTIVCVFLFGLNASTKERIVAFIKSKLIRLSNISSSQ